MTKYYIIMEKELRLFQSQMIDVVSICRVYCCVSKMIKLIAFI